MMLNFLTLAASLTVAVKALDQLPLKNHGRPNIVVVITDDQDLHMDSLNYMPLLKKHITDHGTFFKRHYCSTAVLSSNFVDWTKCSQHERH